jgi:hypothetical protein
MELITGRIHGFYLACYTVATREGHYGYAKVCADKPESVWQAKNALRKVAVGPYAEEKDALLAVRVEAERKLAQRRVSAERMPCTVA